MWVIAARAEVVGAFLWLEQIDQFGDEGPKPGHGPLTSFAEHGLEAGEGLLDRVEVGAVWREEQQAGAGCLDQVADAGALVAGQVVHDDHVAAPEVGDEDLSNIGLDQSPLIGPSSTIEATMPVMRRPATSVVVLR